MRHLDETLLAEEARADRDGERAERVVRADVARRAIAPDVLLARREREHVAALSVLVDRLAAEAPWDALEELARVAAREETAPGPTVLRREPERLPFADGDVGAERARRFEERHRVGLCGRRHQERAVRVRELGGRPDVLHAAEEVRVTDDDARDVFAPRERPFERREIQRAARPERDGLDRLGPLR